MKSFHLSDDHVLSNVDVRNLFTNIPRNESKKSAKRKLSAMLVCFQSLIRSSYFKLLEFAIKESGFMFNGDLHRQVDGVTRSSA